VRDKAKNNVNLQEELDGQIELEEVRKAIKHMKRGKAVGIDKHMNEICMEVIK